MLAREAQAATLAGRPVDAAALHALQTMLYEAETTVTAAIKAAPPESELARALAALGAMI